MTVSVRVEERDDFWPVDVESKYYGVLSSPLGSLLLVGNGEALTGLYMESQRYRPLVDPAWRRADEVFKRAVDELQAYFAGDLKDFTVPLSPQGTTFQRRVWQALCRIPYGETRTYDQIAVAVGTPRASRAVGLANGHNPISVIIPCHRVIGQNGNLTGYGGGLTRKCWLLEHEAAACR